MNAFGWLILGSIAHATGFAVIGSMAYLALRRFSPAAGALVAASSLMITALVSIIVLGPWPLWWKFTASQEVDPAEAVSAEFPNASQEPRPQGGDSLAKVPEAAGAIKSHSPISEDKTAATSAWMGRFLSELHRPVAERERPRWSWPKWVALGFITSLGVGLARLGLGVWSIQRLRAFSLPIADPDLFDMVEILRAELSCARKVELRETYDLATPATIGWRRPLLLLPGDRRDWSAAERRAVLAHELAHVCRGDYLTGLAAQFSLTSPLIPMAPCPIWAISVPMVSMRSSRTGPSGSYPRQ